MHMLPFTHPTAILAVLLTWGSAHSRQVLLVSEPASNNIASFNAATGASLNSSFVIPTGTTAMAVDRNNRLFTLTQGNIGVYNATTGAAINANFYSGAGVGNSPDGIAVDGSNHVFVANTNADAVVELNATTGALINLSFINSNATFPLILRPGPLALDASGRLFVVERGGTVGVYDTTFGASINVNLANVPSGVIGGLAVDGNNHVFASDLIGSTVYEFDATTGAAINQITGLSHPAGLVLDASNHLFVANSFSGTIGEYDATTLAPINSVFISAQPLGAPYALAFVPASSPEPGSLTLFGLAAAGWVTFWRRRWVAGR